MRYRICSTSDILKNSVRCFLIEGVPVLVARVGDEYFAISDYCSHAGASLSEGHLKEYSIQCPHHGGRFDVRNGEALSLPAVAPVESFGLHIEKDELYLDLDF